MLRDPGIKVTPGLRRQDRSKVDNNEEQSEGQNDSRDRHSSEPESQEHCQLSRILRRPSQHLYYSGTVPQEGKRDSAPRMRSLE